MAGVELATAYYSLVPSMAGTAAAVRGQSAGLSGVWAGIGDDAGKGLKGGMLASVGRLALPLAGAFAAIGIGNLIGDAIRTGVDFAMDGIDIASSVGESSSAVSQLFGDASADIQKYARESVTALGLTRLESLNAAKTFGLFAQSAGLSGPALSGFATDLTTLSADLASFGDTDIQTAIDAIGAALRGESEPIRQFGVLLDDATLKARAMALGIYDGNGALSQQQRVLAAQAEIFAQTSVQQGDAVRTAGELAGQQKRLAASFEEAKLKLGESLLPAMLQLATFANDKLIPVLNTMIDQVGPQLGAALVDAAPAFLELLTAITPLLPELVRAGAEILPALITGFVAISPALIDITSNTASLFSTMNAFFSFLKGDSSLAQITESVFAASGSVSEFAKGVSSAVTAVSSFFHQMAANVGGAIGSAIGFVQSLPSAILGAVSGFGGLLVSAGKSLIGGFIEGIRSMIGAVGDAVGGVLDFAAGFFPNSPAERGPFSGSGWSALLHSGEAIGDQIATGFERSEVNMAPRLHSQMASFSALPAMREESTFGEAANMRTLQLLELIAERSGITVPVPALQGALGSSNVGTSTKGRA